MNPVDHDERKRLIAAKAREIIGEEGLDAATIRRLAAELDFSTRCITHYFADKEELLLWTYEAFEREGLGHFSAVLIDDPADIVGCVMAMTPTDPLNLSLWRLYVGFWDRAGRDPRFAAAQQRSIRAAEELIAGAIALRAPWVEDRRRCAREIIALVNGIAVQALLEPGSWNSAQARALYERYVDCLLSSAGEVAPQRGFQPHLDRAPAARVAPRDVLA
jgi:TetR/AcrR family transcriptional regulator, transcriptional repressor of bet genes